MQVPLPDPAVRLSVAVIGGGLAGLAAARELERAGHAAVVFDKGRGPGGRSATRRAGPFAFDHGAQYFTARAPEFRAVLAGWLRRGVAARWDGRIVSLGDGGLEPARGAERRYVGTPHMNSLAKDLARELDLHRGVRVASVWRQGGRWRLAAQRGVDLGVFDRLVVAVPPSQAIDLLGVETSVFERATELVLRPCWAVMLGLEGRYDVPFDGAFCADSALSWVARDNSKPGRGEREAWVLHASAAWTEAHLDADPDLVCEGLAAELERLTGARLPAVLHRAAHRWRFALPETNRARGVPHDAERGVVLAGDAFHGGRVEGAYCSGLEAARALLGADARAAAGAAARAPA